MINNITGTLNNELNITGTLNNSINNNIYHNYRLKIKEQTSEKTVFYLAENGVKLEPDITIENTPDKVVDNIQLARVVEKDSPYTGAKVGDFYLITTIENSDKIIYTSLSELASGLVTKTALLEGKGIKITTETIDNIEYQRISVDGDSLDIFAILGYTPENVAHKVSIEETSFTENDYPTASSIRTLFDDTIGDIKTLLSKV